MARITQNRTAHMNRTPACVSQVRGRDDDGLDGRQDEDEAAHAARRQRVEDAAKDVDMEINSSDDEGAEDPLDAFEFDLDRMGNFFDAVPAKAEGRRKP